jgi:hypothetical protein
MAQGLRGSGDSAALRVLVCVVALGRSVTGCFNPSGIGPVEGSTDDTSDADGDSSDGGDDATDDTDDTDDEGGESSTGGTTGGDGNEGNAGDACAEYCDLMSEHCGGEFAQYASAPLCEATCARMPPGTPADALGNTVGCRTFHAQLAAGSPEVHCPHAGPTGDGTCGANCESFCSLALSTCEGELAPYVDAEDCIAACDGFATEPPYSAEVDDGDIFACRMRHLTLAALQPDLHCSHIGEVSPVCAD